MEKLSGLHYILTVGGGYKLDGDSPAVRRLPNRMNDSTKGRNCDGDSVSWTSGRGVGAGFSSEETQKVRNDLPNPASA